jgi:Ferritin-like domain
MADMTLEQLDRDGAVLMALARVSGCSRADVLRTAWVGGAALLAAVALPADGDAAAAGDIDILNYALTLEYLQASFYTETQRIGALRGRARHAANVVGAVERAHVDALRKVLGRSAVGRPKFNFEGTTENQTKFLKTAVAFEDLAVAAYKGQAPRIKSRRVLASAVAIHSVEARHAAWMRHLFGIPPTASAFDEPRSKRQVLRTVSATGFISSGAEMTKRGKPHFTG